MFCYVFCPFILNFTPFVKFQVSKLSLTFLLLFSTFARLSRLLRNLTKLFFISLDYLPRDPELFVNKFKSGGMTHIKQLKYRVILLRTKASFNDKKKPSTRTGLTFQLEFCQNFSRNVRPDRCTYDLTLIARYRVATGRARNRTVLSPFRSHEKDKKGL